MIFMATSSIFEKFVIDSDEKLEILLKPVNEKEKYNVPKIDVEKEMDRGEKILEEM
ncbi:MAG: hypothetical protein AWL62_2353 [Halanaerobium sp. T82-1]|jgi:hypothetical protein|nr:MAG: hypothetical protein AWL62_2353 [Halanaerobium sp. T82-1]